MRTVLLLPGTPYRTLLGFLLAGFAVVIGGCELPEPEPPRLSELAEEVVLPAEPDAEPQAPPPPAAAIPNPLPAIADAIVPFKPKPPVRADPSPLVCPQAIDLIIAFEIGSPEAYRRKYSRPLWPGASSGVTVGIGYDLGHRTRPVILMDWEREPHHVRLATAAGITGPLAREHARTLADISIAWDLALHVFDQTSLLEHWRIARRVFVREHFDAAPACVQGALTSVVFNRGGSMAGPGRVEMRAIRDTCLPANDPACVARQIRAMVRLWEGSAIEAGMRRRREAEARLAETATT